MSNADANEQFFQEEKIALACKLMNAVDRQRAGIAHGDINDAIDEALKAMREVCESEGFEVRK